jgi:hypothetical protein
MNACVSDLLYAKLKKFFLSLALHIYLLPLSSSSQSFHPTRSSCCCCYSSAIKTISGINFLHGTHVSTAICATAEEEATAAESKSVRRDDDDEKDEMRAIYDEEFSSPPALNYTINCCDFETAKKNFLI